MGMYSYKTSDMYIASKNNGNKIHMISKGTSHHIFRTYQWDSLYDRGWTLIHYFVFPFLKYQILRRYFAISEFILKEYWVLLMQNCHILQSVVHDVEVYVLTFLFKSLHISWPWDVVEVQRLHFCLLDGKHLNVTLSMFH